MPSKRGSRKLGYSLLSLLYLSVTFYTVTCAFHHDLLQPEVHAHSHSSHDHPDPHDGKPGDPKSGNDLYCKLLQKISSSAVIHQADLLPSLTAVFQSDSDYHLILSESAFRAHLSRGPPSV